MPIKIDAPRAWGWRFAGELSDQAHWDGNDSINGREMRVRVRIMRESDFRKIMAAVRAAERHRRDDTCESLYDLDEALAALGKKGKK